MMDIRLVILLLILLPIVVAGGIAAIGIQMNTLFVVVLGGVMIYLTYTLYSRRIDREVIQSDSKKATPAKLYMDGVDFMPTSKNVLYGYHFKSIAAAGPITGPILAATLWGWLPSLLWLIIGVSFIGWAADYSAIMLSVRNEGNSLSAIAYRLIAPRTRTVLFVFIFFYLLLVAGAFMGVMTALMAARPDVPLGLLTLAIMGLLAGQMLYKWRMDLIVVTLITVIITLLAMALGPFGATVDAKGATVPGPIVQAVNGINGAVDSISGKQPLFVVVDPTRADPRTPAVGADGKRASTALYDAATDTIKTMPSYLFWAIFLLVFSYLGANLPIWRFAQPVNYIGFWVSILAIGLSAVGGLLAPVLAPKVAAFQLPAIKAADLGFAFTWGKAWQPLWPMLFVTIACGAISGWHSLIGSVNTSRQLEYETDALPVGGGGMLTENTLALLSLTAVAITGLAGVGAFATGIGRLLGVLFGEGFVTYGTALGFGVFMVIVLTVVQLLFRVMRVTLTEWLGDVIPVFRNMHVASIVSMVLALFLLLTGTWVYLWQLFGASNQLMAALGLLIVSVWLKQSGRNPLYAVIPMVFMYVTTMAAIIVNGYNQYVNVLTAPAFAGQAIVQAGGWAMVIISVLLFVCAALIAWDGWQAWKRYSAAPKVVAAPAE
ncbi:MAG: carbon starvation protein A [Chloroflexi bacterium]|nr:carbon starvation protein A [Chloroflexota bacterium]